MRPSLMIAIAVLATPVLSSPSFANHATHAKAKHTWQKPKPRPGRASDRAPDRDCTPINGRYGYYGNPWCDTGSSRPPDIDYRERHRSQRR